MWYPLRNNPFQLLSLKMLLQNPATGPDSNIGFLRKIHTKTVLQLERNTVAIEPTQTRENLHSCINLVFTVRCDFDLETGIRPPFIQSDIIILFLQSINKKSSSLYLTIVKLGSILTQMLVLSD